MIVSNYVSEIVKLVNSFSSQVETMSQFSMLIFLNTFKIKVLNNVFSLDDLAFFIAIVKEVSYRTIFEKHRDHQVIGALYMMDRYIIEMYTGEGKTLCAVISAIFLSIKYKNCVIVTVNSYLSIRDYNWMLPIYDYLNIKVGCVCLYNEEFDMLNRKNAYNNQIIYVDYSSLGFDYLKDHIAVKNDDIIQSKLYSVIVDEADSILIDNAKIPYVISSYKNDSNVYLFRYVLEIVNCICLNDLDIDLRSKTCFINNNGYIKIESYIEQNIVRYVHDNVINLKDCKKDEFLYNLYDYDNAYLLHLIDKVVYAKFMLKKDVHYIVRDDNVYIINENTGRIDENVRYSDNLHQAIEAKEEVTIKGNTGIATTISTAMLFKTFIYISGMTGTIMDSKYEIMSIYNVNVVSIPTFVKNIRIDHCNSISMTLSEKMEEIIDLVLKKHMIGQPILLCTVSVYESEVISNMLINYNIKHQVLNAKNDKLEAEIIAMAGMPYAVTIATNIAGRGTDIKLGGPKYNEKLRNFVISVGGLFVICTQRQSSIRLDKQMMGRCARCGDPGETKFFISFEDEIMLSVEIPSIVYSMHYYKNYDAISLLLQSIVSNIQKSIESINHAIREHKLKTNIVVNDVRNVFNIIITNFRDGDVFYLMNLLIKNTLLHIRSLKMSVSYFKIYFSIYYYYIYQLFYDICSYCVDIWGYFCEICVNIETTSFLKSSLYYKDISIFRSNVWNAWNTMFLHMCKHILFMITNHVKKCLFSCIILLNEN